MDKFEFMEVVKDILGEVEVEDLDCIASQMKGIIEDAVKIEKEYDKAGIR